MVLHSANGYSRVNISRTHIPREYTSTRSSYSESNISSAMNSGVPTTLLMEDMLLRVDSPRSPSLTFANVAFDEYVIAFYIPMYDRWVLFVQIKETL
jgi:hypothetical protein